MLLEREREIQAFLAGDPRLLELVRDSIGHVVRSFHAADGETQKDLVQEAMTRLCASLRSGRFRGDATLETYAHSIARYTCIEFLRRKRVEIHPDVESLPSGASWSGPEEMLIRGQEVETHLRAYAALEPDCRELLHLVFVENRSYREVADLFGITEAALKSRIHRCRLALRAGARPGRGAVQSAAAPADNPRNGGQNRVRRVGRLAD